ncbi:hypothetical protein BG003_010377 [Podila horticola]|nr:hypothetical protein BG003_010377 [Podila horticola]
MIRTGGPETERDNGTNAVTMTNKDKEDSDALSNNGNRQNDQSGLLSIPVLTIVFGTLVIYVIYIIAFVPIIAIDPNFLHSVAFNLVISNIANIANIPIYLLIFAFSLVCPPLDTSLTFDSN